MFSHALHAGCETHMRIFYTWRAEMERKGWARLEESLTMSIFAAASFRLGAYSDCLAACFSAKASIALGN